VTELLRWTTEPPELRDPVLLIALEGFVDAGGVAETAALFLRHRWQSELVAAFDRDALIDYRARRPTVVVDNGELRRVEWPTIELHAARIDGPRDAVLLTGPEPDMRWEQFTAETVAAAQRLGVTSVIGLGAYPAAVPHTRPTRVLRAWSGPGRDLVPEAEEIAGYTGPVGGGAVLQAALGEAGIPTVGLWAEVPHYVAATPNPAGALVMVRTVAASVGAQVDTTELEAAATLHQEQIDEAVAEHPDAHEMVAMLERHVELGETSPGLPSGEDIAAEIERFLRSEPEA
jgi:predicted ATP-grasp superfamily ATP-dependent carboligase